MNGFFITGTDTEVGKTFVACALARLFKESGIDVGVMKPVESGCMKGDGEGTDDILIPADALKLKQASGSTDLIEEISLYRFPLPVAPNVAARAVNLVGKDIDFKRIKQGMTRLFQAHEITLVEGVGGLMTPITDTKTITELARLLDLPLIIVAASKLGVMNHTLLTVAHARKVGLKVAGIILNHPAPPDKFDKSLKYNRRELERIKGVPFLGELPFIDGPISELEKTARESIDLKELL